MQDSARPTRTQTPHRYAGRQFRNDEMPSCVVNSPERNMEDRNLTKLTFIFLQPFYDVPTLYTKRHPCRIYRNSEFLASCMPNAWRASGVFSLVVQQIERIRLCRGHYSRRHTKHVWSSRSEHRILLQNYYFQGIGWVAIRLTEC